MRPWATWHSAPMVWAMPWRRAKEGGAESHAGHGGGIMHLLLGTGLLLTRLAIDGLSEVVPNQLGSVQCHTIGEVVGIHGHIDLKKRGSEHRNQHRKPACAAEYVPAPDRR